jgi:hypothetical protein
VLCRAYVIGGLNYVTPGNLSRFYHKDTCSSYLFCLWLESVLKYKCGVELQFLLQAFQWPRRIPIDYIFFFVYVVEIYFEGQKKRKFIHRACF